MQIKVVTKMQRISQLFSLKGIVQLTKANLLILAVGGIARCFVPFLDDQKQLFATAHQADLLNVNFPSNLLDQWDMKPWPTRLVFYSFYKLLHPFYNNKIIFIVLAQALLIILIWLTLRGLTALLPVQSRVYFFNFSFLALLLTTPTIFFQIEYLAVILCLFAFILLNHPRNAIRYFGEAILLFVTSLKGITVFFPIFTLLVILGMRTQTRKETAYFIFRNLVLSAIALFIVSKDVISSAIAQGASNHNIGNLFSLRNLEYIYLGLKGALIDMPFLLYLPVLFIMILMRKDRLLITFFYGTLCGIYLVSLVFQINFTYHYCFFLLVLILSFFLLDKARPFPRYTINFPVMLLIALILIKYWIPITLSSSSLNFVVNSNSKIASTYNDLGSEIEVFTQVQKIVGSDDLLFLTDGIANFYLGNQSACREYFPVHFQRSLMYPTSAEIRDSYRYKNFIRCATTFAGKYSLLQTSWIPVVQANFLLQKDSVLVKQFTTGIRDYNLYIRKD